jgi:hypothetical protein
MNKYLKKILNVHHRKALKFEEFLKNSIANYFLKEIFEEFCDGILSMEKI